MKLAQEPWSQELWQEAQPLIERGFRDLDPFQEVPLDVNVKAYEQLQKLGVLRIYTARVHPSGRLIGYAVFMVAPSIRRRYLIQANQDVLHVDASYQRQAAVALLKYSEICLQTEGVGLIYQSCPIGSRFGALLEKFGYQPALQTYAKLMR